MIISQSKRLTIIILGYIIRGPMGGRVWADLHYLLGLRALGHNVYFLEDSGDYDGCCFDFARNIQTNDPSYGLKMASRIFDNLELGKQWAYYDAHSDRWYGRLGEKIKQVAKEADILIGFCRVHQLRTWFEQIPVKILIDKDPVFSQIKSIKNKEFHNELIKYTHFFTFFENLELDKAKFPMDGLDWKPTRHPIFLDLWPSVKFQNNGYYSTIMRWDSYASEEYEDINYGMKSKSFEIIFDLPLKTTSKLELMVAVKGQTKKQLENSGWRLIDPLKESIDVNTYQEYIQHSKAELTIAKEGYVKSHSGWFSERSASYLASGRPVITQQTGFSEWLPTGEGVLAFKNLDQAIASIAEVNSRYEFHCKKAREIAVEFFNYRIILANLLEQAMNSI